MSLTDKGTEVLGELRKAMESNVRGKLSCLGDKELEELSVSLMKLIAIGSKLE